MHTLQVQQFSDLSNATSECTFHSRVKDSITHNVTQLSFYLQTLREAYYVKVNFVSLVLYIVFCVGGSKQKECFIYHEVASVLYGK